MRLDAYYFGFDSTGNEDIDRVLSAVACAGKAYHHTSDWTEPIAKPYEPTHRGGTCAEWIQNAANDAATKLAAAYREGVIEGLERLESELDDLARRFRRTGATLPAPDLTGTPEGSVLTGMCVALASVEIRRDEIRAEIAKLKSEAPRTP